MNRFPTLILVLLALGYRAEAFTTRVSNFPSVASSWRYRTCPLYSSRRPRKEDYLYDDDDGDDDYYGSKYLGKRREETELRKMEYKDEDEDDDDDYYDEDVVVRGNRNKMERNRYEDDDDDDELEEDGPTLGNFWSNSKEGMDRPTPIPRRDNYERDYDRRDSRRDPNDDRRRPRRRTTFRTGTPIPKPAKDFYERLFWSGFDPDETEEVGDATVFGGTKGKFNGLSYLSAVEKGPNRNSRQLPPSKRDYDDYDDDDVEDDSDDDYRYQASRPPPKSVKPPNDVPFPRSERVDPADRRAAPRSERVDPADRRAAKRQRRRRGDYNDDDDDNYGDEGENNWISNQVSSWFSLDDDKPDEYDTRSGRRQQRQQPSEWSPFNILDAFFGVDRGELEYKKDMYNDKMGIGPGKSSRRRRRPSGDTGRQESPRRPGYAYRYNVDDNESPPVADIDTMSGAVRGDTPTRGDRTRKPVAPEEKPAPRTREKSWEERALAVERVPPANMAAWGPSGELPTSIDARTKGIMDALEDIQTSEQKLTSKKKKESLAREDISILQVDAELQRRRVGESRKGARLEQERLRQIELDIDDAGRVLRRARTQVQIARDQLEELKDRHWAMLSFYDSDQAEEKVKEALNEFQQIEPAARLEDFIVPQPSIDKVKAANVQAPKTSFDMNVKILSDDASQS